MSFVRQHHRARQWGVVVLAASALTACSSPKLEVSRLNLFVGEAITITSKEHQRLLIRSAVANNNNDNTSCNQAVGKSLDFDESTTVFFSGCGDVVEFTIYTDNGSWSGKRKK